MLLTLKPLLRRPHGQQCWFVALKSEAQQARAMLFRTRQMFIGQRTQSINALRGHLAEQGVVAPKGTIHVRRLADAVANEAIRLVRRRP